MNGWEFLDKLLDRMPGWPDGRGLVGVAIFLLTLLLFAMMVAYPELRQDEFFKAIATAIIVTGFINGVVAYAFSQSQAGKEGQKVEGPIDAKIINAADERVPVEDEPR